MMYSEENFLQLSGIQHFEFCRRQWALTHIEQQWQENVRTFEGKLLHDKAHDSFLRETRGDEFISRGMPIHSNALGISGECDIVEFHKEDEGINIVGRDGYYRVIPIEYKRGKPKEGIEDSVQLAAEAICLEEMLCCEIKYGYIYDGEIRRRQKIHIDDVLRNKVRDIVSEMHQYYDRRYTPKVKVGKKCNACSLKDICVPELNKNRSVSSYIDNVVNDGGDDL